MRNFDDYLYYFVEIVGKIATILWILFAFFFFSALLTSAFASGWQDELDGSHLERWEASQQRMNANIGGTHEQYAPPPDYTRGLSRPTDWEELLRVPSQPRTYVPDNRRWENGQ